MCSIWHAGPDRNFSEPGDDDVPAGPLRLCKCEDCDLVQLTDNYDLSKLYGETYGYRSG